jgi:sugar lactone lactonase YvrE
MNWQIVNPLPCELGESPFWHPAEHMLYWVDIPGQKIHRANVQLGNMEAWDMPLEPGCIAPAASGGLVIALRDGVYRAQEWGGPLSLLQRFDHDPATTRFNDGKADPQGRLWAGTMFEPRTAPKGELFSLDCRDGRAPLVQLMATGATIANGVAWSPDQRTAYWTDTTRALIQAWNWDATSNTLTAQRIFKQFPPKPDPLSFETRLSYGGRPDGASVDVEGNYWVAMFEGQRILKLSPGGDILAELQVPAQCPTMPCFGGEDGKTLFVTTARHGRSAAELDMFPHSGCVFSTRVDVPGLPVNFFRD